MERFEAAPDPETARIAKLAEVAQALASKIDLTREPDGHIYAAMTAAGIRDKAERRRLFGKIKAELHRRRPLPFSQRKDLVEDARSLSDTMHPKEEEEN